MEKKIVVTRIFNAPVKLAWKTWTEPELVMRWWGPERFTCPYAQIDFREGGRSVVSMLSPKEMGGQEWFNAWDYVRIVPMESIEFIQTMSDRQGNQVDPVSVGMPADFPAAVRTLVLFKSLAGNRTAMTVTQFADMGQMAKFALLGLEQSMDKMLAVFREPG